MKLRIVPVAVFGGCAHHGSLCDEWGYGLMDATSAWSDCNRAIGHIFRVDDLTHVPNGDRQTIEIEVRDEDMWFFEKNWDEDA